MDKFVIILAIVLWTTKTQAQAALRVQGGSHDCEGRVQLLQQVSNNTGNISEHWRFACSRESGENEAAVVCRELGCGAGTREHPDVFGSFGVSVDSVTAFPYRCIGNEDRVADCQIAAVTCSVINRGGADILAVNCSRTSPPTDLTTAAGTTAMPQDETDSTGSGAATNLPSAVIMVLLQVLFLISLQ